MPEVVANLLVPVKLVEITRHQASQWEPTEVVTAREQNNQDNRKQETWNGITNNHHRTRPNIKPRAVMYRLHDA